jgi:hypothetical protein
VLGTAIWHRNPHWPCFDQELESHEKTEADALLPFLELEERQTKLEFERKAVVAGMEVRLAQQKRDAEASTSEAAAHHADALDSVSRELAAAYMRHSAAVSAVQAQLAEQRELCGASEVEAAALRAEGAEAAAQHAQTIAHLESTEECMSRELRAQMPGLEAQLAEQAEQTASAEFTCVQAEAAAAAAREGQEEVLAALAVEQSVQQRWRAERDDIRRKMTTAAAQFEAAVREAASRDVSAMREELATEAAQALWLREISDAQAKRAGAPAAQGAAERATQMAATASATQEQAMRRELAAATEGLAATTASTERSRAELQAAVHAVAPSCGLAAPPMHAC